MLADLRSASTPSVSLRIYGYTVKILTYCYELLRSYASTKEVTKTKVYIKRVMKNCNNCIISDDDDLETVNTYSGEIQDKNLINKDSWSKDSHVSDVLETKNTGDIITEERPASAQKIRRALRGN